MALTSLCNTAVPLFLGMLLDGITNGSQQGLSHAALYRLAAWFLGLIGLAYLLRARTERPAALLGRQRLHPDQP